MSSFSKILNSFNLQDELNPKVWDSDSDGTPKMNRKVRKALLEIADEFSKYLGEDIFINDVVLTGSLANFNWSEYSDFDLHLLIDYESLGENAELYREIHQLKKQIFNDKHNIKIYGFDVELYPQDIEESHFSSGLYSVLNDEWINRPDKDMEDIDRDLLETKIKSWIDKIESVLENGDYEKVKNLIDKIKKYRKSGLEKEGITSYENYVFKFLRRSKYIQLLFDKYNQFLDKELSIESMMQD